MKTICLALTTALLTAGCVHRRPSPPTGPQPARDRPARLPPSDRGDATYAKPDVLAAGERALGTGAAGTAQLIDRAFADLGAPNAIITGREAGGATASGLRYGSGTLYRRSGAEQPMWWSGPGAGLSQSGEGGRVLMLIYHLRRTTALFRSFPAVEGRVYLIGGFAMTYHQHGRVVLVPIRPGIGWRVSARVGALMFTRRPAALPF